MFLDLISLGLTLLPTLYLNTIYLSIFPRTVLWQSLGKAINTSNEHNQLLDLGFLTPFSTKGNHYPWINGKFQGWIRQYAPVISSCARKKRCAQRMMKPCQKDFEANFNGFPTVKCSILGIKIQSVFIIHRFHICKSAYSLKWIRNFQINTQDTFTVIHRRTNNSKEFELSDVHIPSWGQMWWHSSFLFQLL